MRGQRGGGQGRHRRLKHRPKPEPERLTSKEETHGRKELVSCSAPPVGACPARQRPDRSARRARSEGYPYPESRIDGPHPEEGQVDRTRRKEEGEVKNKNGSGEAALVDEITGLRQKVMELSARLQSLEVDLEDSDGGESNGNRKPTSRRGLLRLARALAAGAAGGLVLRPIPVAAATGGNMILGNPNDANAPSSLSSTAGPPPNPLFEVIGQNPPAIPANPSAHESTASPPVSTNVTVPVLLAVAPFAVFPTTGTPPATVFPGVAPIQGIGGTIHLGTSPNDLHLAEGVDGFAAVDPADLRAVGGGVVGTSDFGIGVVGSGGTDIAAFGTGYLAQTSITDATGLTPGAGTPPSPVHTFQQFRDK